MRKREWVEVPKSPRKWKAVATYEHHHDAVTHRNVLRAEGMTAKVKMRKRGSFAELGRERERYFEVRIVESTANQ